MNLRSLALALPLSAALAAMQPPDARGAGGLKPPLFTALDVNQDGIISADEIAKASTALKTLDKNGDGELTLDECLPPRPEGPQARR